MQVQEKNHLPKKVEEGLDKEIKGLLVDIKVEKLMGAKPRDLTFNLNAKVRVKGLFFVHLFLFIFLNKFFFFLII